MPYSLTGKNQRAAMHAAATGEATAKRSFHISYHACCEAWEGNKLLNVAGVVLAKKRGFISYFPTETHRIVKLVLTDKGRKELNRLAARGITE